VDLESTRLPALTPDLSAITLATADFGADGDVGVLPPHISGCHRHRLGRPETRHPLNRRVKPGNQLRGDWPGPCRNGDNMAGVFENALLRRFRATVTDNVK
jgi:hypothetical protein